MQTTSHSKRGRRGSLRRRALVLAISTAAVAIAVSCVHTVNRLVMAPPQIAGATFVGSESCAECHDDVIKGFTGATHSWLQAHDGTNISCESCHGPASLHVETGGALHTIVNPGTSPDTCFDCHLDKKGEFRLAHSHPVLEGKVTCADCHSVHTGDAVMGRGTTLASQNDTCLQCHDAQRGPYAFEHEATREGCTSCHAPHGSINNKMLVARNANLCLQCHTTAHSNDNIFVGQRDHSVGFAPGSPGFLATGTCWSAGCHEAVHGSHFSSSLRF